jgi:hypothetical protein
VVSATEMVVAGAVLAAGAVAAASVVLLLSEQLVAAQVRLASARPQGTIFFMRLGKSWGLVKGRSPG